MNYITLNINGTHNEYKWYVCTINSRQLWFMFTVVTILLANLNDEEVMLFYDVCIKWDVLNEQHFIRLYRNDVLIFFTKSKKTKHSDDHS